MKYRKIFYTFSTTLMLLSVASLWFFGLNLGIDFKGGSLMELRFQEDAEGVLYTPTKDEIRGVLSDLELGALQIQETSTDSVFLRFNDVDEETHLVILVRIGSIGPSVGTSPDGQIDSSAENEGLTEVNITDEGVLELELDEEAFQRITGQRVAAQGSLIEERFESIGPVIGRETIRKSLQAIVLVLILVVGYIAWAFRKISHPIGSVKYGLSALVALFHDILITMGAFSILSHFSGAEVGVPFVAALLTILGYSVNDTIVIFDRIRENLSKVRSNISFEDIVSRSARESLVRSVNSSATTLFVLTAILLFGGATLYSFILTLIIGISIGTYSSLAVASPLLVSLARGKS